MGAVLDIMQHGICVQRGCDLVDRRGKPFRQLGIYWDPGLGVVVKVDEADRVAVTVLAAGGNGAMRHKGGRPWPQGRCANRGRAAKNGGVG